MIQLSPIRVPRTDGNDGLEPPSALTLTVPSGQSNDTSSKNRPQLHSNSDDRRTDNPVPLNRVHSLYTHTRIWPASADDDNYEAPNTTQAPSTSLDTVSYSDGLTDERSASAQWRKVVADQKRQNEGRKLDDIEEIPATPNEDETVAPQPDSQDGVPAVTEDGYESPERTEDGMDVDGKLSILICL